ncbi:MAG: 2OG-Fe(II) oxygenase [Caldimonas sp.]
MSPRQVTLPIAEDDGLRMDANEAKGLGDLLHEDYVSAQPFPHIVVDGVLPGDLPRRILANFPVEALASDTVFNINYGGHFKRQVAPEDCNAFVRELFHFFNSRPMLAFLEGLSGITGLLPDPYFEGGGFHEISTGGLLGIHADFRIHERLHLQRRLNLLIYLNENWQDEWNGRLELWDRKMQGCVKAISPLINRCVVFNTDADSYHGHPDPLATPPEVKRRSIALYYYTASKAVYREVPNLSTMYHARPTDSAAVRREAAAFRATEYFKDFAPPVLFRLYEKVRWRLHSKQRQT